MTTAPSLRGCSIPVEIYSVQDCPTYSCLIVNDQIMLSYSEAALLAARNRQVQLYHRVVSNRFVRWCVVRLYNLFVWSSGNADQMLVPRQEPTDGQPQET